MEFIMSNFWWALLNKSLVSILPIRRISLFPIPVWIIRPAVQ